MSTQPTMQARAGHGGGQVAAQAGQQARHRATYQDVLDAPPHKVAEIVDGRLHLHPRPAMPHTTAGSLLGAELIGPFRRGRGGPGGWRILDEPEVHFGTPPEEDVLVPDIAGWRLERMPESPDTAFVTLAPDWVCEILSPSTRRFDLGDKRDIYAREGVPYMWLLDPDSRSLEAFVLQKQGEKKSWQQIAKLSGDAQVSLPPFDAISFPLQDLWD